MILTDQEQADLTELQRLLDEAYEHYFKYGDGHCKSQEGYVELAFNNYFERNPDNRGLQVTQVTVYSYVFGPLRSHEFPSTRAALETVREWHREAMAHDYSEEGMFGD